MANGLYAYGRELFLDGQISWTGATIKAALVELGVYTADLANDRFLSTIGSAVVTTVTLESKSVTGGVADANDAVFPNFDGVAVGEAVVIYKDTGNAGTSPLIAYIDTADGLPVEAGSGTVAVVWGNDSNKIFKL